MPNKRLLVIEDDYDVAEMLAMYFGAQKYDVFHADSGMMGVEMARSHFPQLILLDVMMPDIDGYETCFRLRHMTLTKYIPIIFLSQRDERANKVRGLELGADDYITKPFDVDELRLRVEGAIRRATRESLHEPRSGLPTGKLVDEEIQRRQDIRRTYTDLRLTLDGYNAYGDVYGFVAASEVLGFAAQVLQEAVSQHGTSDDFVGVLDDQFVVLTQAGSPKTIETAARQKFSQGIRLFYTFADVERGGLLVHPGTNQEQIVPLMDFVSVQAKV